VLWPLVSLGNAVIWRLRTRIKLRSAQLLLRSTLFSLVGVSAVGSHISSVVLADSDFYRIDFSAVKSMIAGGTALVKELREEWE